MVTKISTNDDYVITHQNIREGANISLSHTENPTTTIVGLSPVFSERVDNIELDLNEAKQELVEAQADIASLDTNKQDKLKTANTQTVNMSFISNIVRGSVNISDNEDNILTIENDGLYAPSTTTTTTTFADSALEGEHIDLSNYVLPNTVTTVNTWYGKALTKNPILDVIFETQDSTGTLHQYESRALYKITDTNQIEINLTTITSALLAKNLTNVLSFTTL